MPSLDRAATLELEKSQRESRTRFQLRMEDIFDRYSKDMSAISDEIDIRTGAVVIDHGHMHGLADIEGESEDEVEGTADDASFTDEEDGLQFDASGDVLDFLQTPARQAPAWLMEPEHRQARPSMSPFPARPATRAPQPPTASIPSNSAPQRSYATASAAPPPALGAMPSMNPGMMGTGFGMPFGTPPPGMMSDEMIMQQFGVGAGPAVVELLRRQQQESQATMAAYMQQMSMQQMATSMGMGMGNPFMMQMMAFMQQMAAAQGNAMQSNLPQQQMPMPGMPGMQGMPNMHTRQPSPLGAGQNERAVHRHRSNEREEHHRAESTPKKAAEPVPLRSILMSTDTPVRQVIRRPRRAAKMPVPQPALSPSPSSSPVREQRVSPSIASPVASPIEATVPVPVPVPRAMSDSPSASPGPQPLEIMVRRDSSSEQEVDAHGAIDAPSSRPSSGNDAGVYVDDDEGGEAYDDDGNADDDDEEDDEEAEDEDGHDLEESGFGYDMIDDEYHASQASPEPEPPEPVYRQPGSYSPVLRWDSDSDSDDDPANVLEAKLFIPSCVVRSFRALSPRSRHIAKELNQLAREEPSLELVPMHWYESKLKRGHRSQSARMLGETLEETGRRNRFRCALSRIRTRREKQGKDPTEPYVYTARPRRPKLFDGGLDAHRTGPGGQSIDGEVDDQATGPTATRRPSGADPYRVRRKYTKRAACWYKNDEAAAIATQSQVRVRRKYVKSHPRWFKNGGTDSSTASVLQGNRPKSSGLGSQDSRGEIDTSLDDLDADATIDTAADDWLAAFACDVRDLSMRTNGRLAKTGSRLFKQSVARRLCRRPIYGIPQHRPPRAKLIHADDVREAMYRQWQAAQHQFQQQQQQQQQIAAEAKDVDAPVLDSRTDGVSSSGSAQVVNPAKRRRSSKRVVVAADDEDRPSTPQKKRRSGAMKLTTIVHYYENGIEQDDPPYDHRNIPPPPPGVVMSGLASPTVSGLAATVVREAPSSVENSPAAPAQDTESSASKGKTWMAKRSGPSPITKRQSTFNSTAPLTPSPAATRSPRDTRAGLVSTDEVSLAQATPAAS